MYLSTVAPRLFNPSPLIKMPTYPPSIPPFHRALFFNNYFTNTPHQHNYSPKTLSQSHMLPHTLAPSSKSAPCNTWMQLCPSLVTWPAFILTPQKTHHRGQHRLISRFFIQPNQTYIPSRDIIPNTMCWCRCNTHVNSRLHTTKTIYLLHMRDFQCWNCICRFVTYLWYLPSMRCKRMTRAWHDGISMLRLFVADSSAACTADEVSRARVELVGGSGERYAWGWWEDMISRSDCWD